MEYNQNELVTYWLSKIPMHFPTVTTKYSCIGSTGQTKSAGQHACTPDAFRFQLGKSGAVSIASAWATAAVIGPSNKLDIHLVKLTRSIPVMNGSSPSVTVVKALRQLTVVLPPELGPLEETLV